MLTELAELCAAIRTGAALQERRMADRRDLFIAAHEAGVSWADLGRVAGIAPETILTIVKTATATT